MSELIGNRAIENAAIGSVIAFEGLQGRVAVDTRGKGVPADLESAGRVIEVKAYGVSTRGQDLWLEARQVQAGISDRDGGSPRADQRRDRRSGGVRRRPPLFKGGPTAL